MPLDHDLEGHALAFGGSGEARVQLPLDDRVGQVPEQVEPARADALRQAEQAAEDTVEVRPDALQRARRRAPGRQRIGFRRRLRPRPAGL